ncbi:acetyl-CoA C-acyltransferase [Microvirga tunisiensis]|uniref:Acetyl-CoA C-acyltransferase n=2 Tax=Pannonibacter tanglangensis TaxID=2750084 RepID=A0A7X5F5T3_9HYPH|nr:MULTISPECIES: thiolase family protein [unclassified Pannonibacter]NBN65475.1 acetyl-CoA C-acyltransferase [Pannonibacter sp. XCT-34]NBN80298.1 acetyl-CoA C-acyltransferase [Pannonibacter sp. XCT-53]
MTEVVIVAARRSPVAPRGGALSRLDLAGLAAPVVQAVLQDAGLDAARVDDIVLGNALGAGGNPARLVGLAAGLPDHVSGLSIDRQCCSGLDAVVLAARSIRAGDCDLVLAGGVESYSRSPIRAHRPLDPGGQPVPYDRPAFVADPARDPDPLVAAAHLAQSDGWLRSAQEDHAMASHKKALMAETAGHLAGELVPLAGLARDSFARALDPVLLRRLKPLAGTAGHALTAATVAVEADAAALLLLASRSRAEALGLPVLAVQVGAVQSGGRPEDPALVPRQAIADLLARLGWTARSVARVELMEAFAVQALACLKDMDLPPEAVNAGGGALARGHPIGASGAILLVRLVHELQRLSAGDRGLAAIAAVGGLATAVALRRP